MNSIQISNSRIQGLVGGTSLNAGIRTSPAGLAIPPGEYLLIAGTNNPVTGPVLALVPKDGASAPRGSSSDPGAAKGAIYMRFESPAQQGGMLPVAARAVGGSECIVVDRGFQDLVWAVAASGGSLSVKII